MSLDSRRLDSRQERHQSIFNLLPFGQLWYENASGAVDYAKQATSR
jgi:hypothetical protein